MEITTFDKDIKVLYVTATSFPDGIPEAHERLHILVPVDGNRKFFGISRPEHGVIIYKAAAEELYEGEAAKLGCNSMILASGGYITIQIDDYVQNIQSIGCAFRELLASPGLDPEGYCVEWYLSGKSMKCMIRLNE
jgi:hypothetical protein